MPDLVGNPLAISALPLLSAYRGKLLSSSLERGTPVHAASFVRQRKIVLEAELLDRSALAFILIHEIFHFVWVRMGNAERAAYTGLVEAELRAKARGEVGESAAVAKERACQSRDYVCESFCDSAAWIFAPEAGADHITLAKRWRARRREWFGAHLVAPIRC